MKMNEQQVRFYENKLEFEIDSWDLFEAQKSNREIVVLDVRSEAAYEKEHIRGAISFPHRRMTPDNTAHFSKSALHVVYCDGIGCNASTGGALKMAKLGFAVKELMGGLEWWKRSHFPTDAGSNDVRTAEVQCGCA